MSMFCILLGFLLISVTNAALVGLTVDAAAADEMDPGGSNCKGSGSSLVACSLRSAWSYCADFSAWAQAEQSAVVNSCSIDIPEDSVINLNSSYGYLYMGLDTFPNAQKYNFSISLSSSGRGAKVKRMLNDWSTRAMGVDGSGATGIVAISNVAFYDFYKGDNGGALNLYGLESVELTNVNITQCGGSYGGAAYIAAVSYLTISTCGFRDNGVSGDGGALYISDVSGSVTISGSIISNNVATSSGGGITAGGGIYFQQNVENIAMSNTVVQFNSASNGAGLYFYSSNKNIFINNTVISWNAASMAGGGVGLNAQNQNFVCGNVTFESNSAESGGGLYVDTANKPITLENVNMIENSASVSGGGVYLLNQDDFTATGVLFDGNEAVASDGGGIYIDGSSSYISVTESVISNNRAASHGAAIACGFSVTTLTFENVNFTSNTGAFQGGALYFFSDASDVQVSGSIFQSNSAEFGGGLFIDQSSFNFDLSNTIFLDNVASVSGGAIYIGLHNTNISVLECTFEGNSAVGLEGGAVMIGSQNTAIYFSNTTFHGNSADRGAGGGIQIEFENKEITITNAVFTNNTASTGGAISASTDNSISSISGSTFSFNGGLVSGGAITFSSQNTATVTSCTFTNNAITAFNSLVGGGALFVYEYNNVVIDHSTISSNTVTSNGQGGGGILVSTNNVVAISGSTFSNNVAETSGGAIHCVSYNTIDISSSRFDSNVCSTAGGAVAIDSYHAAPNIYGNTFTENVANNGGALFIGDESTTSTVGSESKDVRIDSNQFSSNSAVYGGALVLAEVLAADISNCTFTDNFVITSSISSITTDSTSITNDYSGGAVALLNSCADVTFSNCTMFNNSAYYGSALYLNEAEQVILSYSTLTENVAEAYGTIYWVYSSTADPKRQVPQQHFLTASGNTQVYGEITSDQNTLFATQGISLVVDDSDSVVNQIITISDYGVDPTINVHVVDYYQSPKYTDEGRSISASAQSGFNGCFDQGTGWVSGETITSTVDGYVNFTALTVSCFPSGNMTLVFSATSLDSATVFVDFEECDDGYYLSNFECTQCPTGEYSLEYTGDTTTCTAAPSNTDSTLTYGNNIYVSPGYWRINNYTTTMTACPYGSDACLGEYRYGTNSCSTGYEGVLCGVCSSGYYESSVSSTPICEKCSSSTSIIFVLLAPVLISLVLIGFIIVGNLGAKRFEVLVNTIAFGGQDQGSVKSFNNSNNGSSFYAGDEAIGTRLFDMLIGKIKILISVFQIVSDFPGIFDVTFPSSLMAVLRAFSFVNIIGMEMPSADCYASGRFDYVDTLLMTTLLPIMVAIAIFLTGGLELLYFDYHFRGSEIDARIEHRKLFTRYITLFLLLTYMVLPSVSTYIAGAYACTDSDPDNVVPGPDLYLMSDLAISCSSPRYEFGVAWASFMLFVYPIGIPAMYFYLLYTNRSDIANRYDTEYVSRRGQNSRFSTSALGFLYTQYEPQFWYWEVIETLRRLFFTSLLAFGISTSTYQIVGSLMMAVIFMKLYAFYKPYKDDGDDILQEVAQYQVFFTLFGALLIDSNSFGSNNTSFLSIGITLVIINVSTTAIALYFVAIGWMELEEEREAKEAANSLDDIGDGVRVEEGSLKDKAPPSPVRLFQFFRREVEKKIHPAPHSSFGTVVRGQGEIELAPSATSTGHIVPSDTTSAQPQEQELDYSTAQQQENCLSIGSDDRVGLDLLVG